MWISCYLLISWALQKFYYGNPKLFFTQNVYMTILNCLIEWFKFCRAPCSWVKCWVFVQGVLSNNTIVAVKRLFMKTQQASSDFTNEVVLIANLRHQNLVNLKGFCLKGKEMLLVYEYVDNYDLDKILFGKFTHTFWLGKTWEQSWRMKITSLYCCLSSILLLRIILFISYDARLF